MPNPTHNPWTEEDECLLAKAYEQWPVVLPPALLARHALGSCQKRAYQRKITRRRQVGGLFAHVTPTEWAYLAGIIDGEGTIANYTPSTRPWTNRSVIFVNTDRTLIEWAFEKFPGGTLRDVTHKVGPRKQLWKVQWSRSAVVAELIAGMVPYMIVKREKALALLDALPEKFKVAAS